MTKRFLSFASTLRGRLAALICMATLPALIFTFYIAHKERSTALRQAQDEAHYIVNLISREHLHQITGAKKLLAWLTGKLETPGNEAIVTDRNFLAALLSGYPQLSNIAILSPNGDVKNSAYPLPGKINMASYDAISRAFNSEDIETGGYVIGPIVKRPLFHLSKSVRDPEGKLLWIVFVAIDLDWLKAIAEQVELPSQHTLLIVDRNGRVLANSSKHQEKDYAVGTKIPGLDEVSVAKGNTKDKRKPGSFVTVPMKDISGVSIATRLPYKEIYNEANQTFFRILFMLSGLTLCTVISVVILEEIALLRYIRALSNATRKFGNGDYATRAPVPRGYGELENMARDFNNMAQTLTERHSELAQAHDELDKLSRHLQIARESEAKRISRDLHDEIGQVLTSIKMDLFTFESKCTGESFLPCQGNVESIREKLDNLVRFVRGVASDLRPPVLDRMGVVAAIEHLARKSEENSKFAVDIEAADVDESLDWLTSITIYRIVQESLTNITRHANAEVVTIQLEQTEAEIVLSVKDDGQGFDHLQEESDSLGIIGMRERARLLGGTFHIESKAGSGTVIGVSIPLDSKAKKTDQLRGDQRNEYSPR